MAEGTTHPPANLLLFAEAATAGADDLCAQLGANGCGVMRVSRIAQGLAAIIRRPPDAPPFTHALILTPLSGLPPLSIAKALRNLPGQSTLPLILVDHDAAGLAACASLAHPVDPAALYRMLTNRPAPAAKTEPAAAGTPAAAREHQVLVVDDNPVNRYLLCHQVRNCGLPVASCSNGEEALRRTSRGDIALILMDCQMPVMDGYETTTIIRKEEGPAGRHLPIIAVTAHALPENQQRCRQVGMDDFLAKPIRQSDLQSALDRWWPYGAAAAAAEVGTSAPVVPGDGASAPEDDIFNPAHLQKIEADSPGTSAMIIGMMQQDLQQATEDFPTLLTRAELTPLALAAHKLKGSSGSIGARQLMQACLVLEHAARKSDRAGSNAACLLTVAAIERLQLRLKTIFHL